MGYAVEVPEAAAYGDWAGVVGELACDVGDCGVGVDGQVEEGVVAQGFEEQSPGVLLLPDVRGHRWWQARSGP